MPSNNVTDHSLVILKNLGRVGFQYLIVQGIRVGVDFLNVYWLSKLNDTENTDPTSSDDNNQSLADAVGANLAAAAMNGFAISLQALLTQAIPYISRMFGKTVVFRKKALELEGSIRSLERTNSLDERLVSMRGELNTQLTNARNEEFEMGSLIHQLWIGSVIFSGVCIPLMVFFKPILVSTGVDDELAKLAQQITQPSAYALPLNFLNSVDTSVLFATGNGKYYVISSLIGAGVSALTGYSLILGELGSKGLGAAGIGYSALTSAISIFLVNKFFMRWKYPNYQLFSCSRKRLNTRLAPSGRLYGLVIIGDSAPLALSNVVATGIALGTSVAIGSLPPDRSTVAQSLGTWNTILSLPAQTFTMAAGIFISHDLDKRPGSDDNIRKYMKFSIWGSAVLTSVSTIVYWAIPKQLQSVFSEFNQLGPKMHDQLSLNYGLYSLSSLLQTITFCFSSNLNNIHQTIRPSIAFSASMILFLPFIITVLSSNSSIKEKDGLPLLMGGTIFFLFVASILTGRMWCKATNTNESLTVAIETDVLDIGKCKKRCGLFKLPCVKSGERVSLLGVGEASSAEPIVRFDRA